MTLNDTIISQEDIEQIKNGEEITLENKRGDTVKLKPSCDLQDEHDWRRPRVHDELEGLNGDLVIRHQCRVCDKREYIIINFEGRDQGSWQDKDPTEDPDGHPAEAAD